MIIIRNLISNERIGLRYKNNISAKCASSSGLKATGFFVILPSQDGFERLSRNKVPTNHFLKSAEKKPYADVLQNFPTVKHLCQSFFLIKLKKEGAPTEVSIEYEHVSTCSY